MSRVTSFDEFTYFKINEEVDFHGRSGKVTGVLNGNYLVYFGDMNEEIAIEIKELEEQNNIEYGKRIS